MSAFISEFTDTNEAKLYDYLFGRALVDVEVLYGCLLPSRDHEEVELFAIKNTNPSVEPTAEEQAALQDCLLSRQASIQKIMCGWYHDSYPVVCDVGAELTARILDAKTRDLFTVYLVIGGYRPFAPGSYHAWIVAEGKQSGYKWVIDFTYIQFMQEFMTAHTVTREDGTVTTLCSHEGLRELVSRCADSVKFPSPIIGCTDAAWENWMPYAVSRVL